MAEPKHYIFKTLDNTPRILYWHVDEFLIMIVPVFFGIIFGYFILMFGAFLIVPYGRLKKRLSHQSTAHYAYWYLPTSYLQAFGQFKRLPPSHTREYLL